MINISNEKISTKEKIIRAAFSLSVGNNYSKMSLSQIAKEVGISKTAIYRHFKNKDDLETAMKNRLFEQVVNLLKELEEKYESDDFYNIYMDILRFGKNHPEYLYFSLFSTPKIGEDHFFIDLKEHGVKQVACFFDEDNKIADMEVYIKGLFTAGSMIDFMCTYVSICACSDMKAKFREDFESVASKTVHFIINGVQAKKRDFNIDFDKLDKLSKVSLEVLQPVDKKMIALSNVISTVGFPNVTVEAVANELGLAKSSLYSWFENKSEMLISLISEEFTQMVSLINKNISVCSSFAEKIYVFLSTQYLYFANRKETVTVSKWMQFSGDFEHNSKNSLVEQSQTDLLYKNLNLDTEIQNITGYKVSDFETKLFTGWIFSFPVFLYLNADNHKFTQQEINTSLRSLFYMIMNSILGGNC